MNTKMANTDAEELSNRFDNLVNQPSVEGMPRKGSRQYCELITKVQGGDIFRRSIISHGRRYWQWVRYLYVDGKRKLRIIQHCGPYKPRGKYKQTSGGS